MVMAIESTGPLTCAQHMTKTYSYGHKCITQINNKNSLSKKQVCLVYQPCIRTTISFRLVCVTFQVNC